MLLPSLALLLASLVSPAAGSGRAPRLRSSSSAPAAFAPPHRSPPPAHARLVSVLKKGQLKSVFAEQLSEALSVGADASLLLTNYCVNPTSK